MVTAPPAFYCETFPSWMGNFESAEDFFSLFNSAFIPELQPPVCSKMKVIFSLDLGKIIYPVWLYQKYIYIFFSYYSEDKKLGLTGRNLWKDISINWVIEAVASCTQMSECLNCTDKEWSKSKVILLLSHSNCWQDLTVSLSFLMTRKITWDTYLP